MVLACLILQALPARARAEAAVTVQRPRAGRSGPGPQERSPGRWVDLEGRLGGRAMHGARPPYRVYRYNVEEDNRKRGTARLGDGRMNPVPRVNICSANN